VTTEEHRRDDAEIALCGNSFHVDEAQVAVVLCRYHQ